MADDDDKTEEPTSRKLEKAREEGNVPKSEDYNGFLGLLITIITLYLLYLMYPEKILYTMGTCFESIFVKSDKYITDKCQNYLNVMSEVGLFIFVSGLFASFFAYFSLNKGFVTPKEPLKFNIAALDIGTNLTNLFKKENFLGLAISLLKEILFYGILIFLLIYFFPGIVYQTFCFENCRGNVPLMFMYMLIGAYILIAFIFTAIDLPLKISQWRDKLKMSHKDLKDEHKESEGAPEVKQAQNQFRHDMATSVPMGPKNATFFIRGNGMIFGIRYNTAESPAPVIVSVGKTTEKAVQIEQVANRMRRLVVQDVDFTKKLAGLGVMGRPVPLEFVGDVRKAIMQLRKHEAEFGPTHPAK